MQARQRAGITDNSDADDMSQSHQLPGLLVANRTAHEALDEPKVRP